MAGWELPRLVHSLGLHLRYRLPQSFGLAIAHSIKYVPII